MASYLLQNGYRTYTYVLTCPGVSVMGEEAFSRGWRESGESWREAKCQLVLVCLQNQ
jgi:hypothetical protein